MVYYDSAGLTTPTLGNKRRLCNCSQRQRTPRTHVPVPLIAGVYLLRLCTGAHGSHTLHLFNAASWRKEIEDTCPRRAKGIYIYHLGSRNFELQALVAIRLCCFDCLVALILSIVSGCVEHCFQLQPLLCQLIGRSKCLRKELGEVELCWFLRGAQQYSRTIFAGLLSVQRFR